VIILDYEQVRLRIKAGEGMPHPKEIRGTCPNCGALVGAKIVRRSITTKGEGNTYELFECACGYVCSRMTRMWVDEMKYGMPFVVSKS
jgi:predicted RNA-binding Zn-ribbon protein involved in translation (DUF1610 family)